MDDQERIIEYEEEILKSQLEYFEQKSAELEQEIKFNEEFDQQYYAAISKRVGFTVDKDNVDNIKLHRTVWGEILDEIGGAQHCLIRPSHQVLKYSLIRKNPELQEHIPHQNTQASGLQLLSDKSTIRATEIVQEYTSENTRKAYMGDLIYWQAWLSAIEFAFTEPISQKEIVIFIVQHAEGLDHDIDKRLVDQGFKAKLGPHKLSTIERRIASLSVALDFAKWPNPTHAKEISQLLSKLTKKYGGSKPAGKAITKDILDDVIDTCETNKLIDIRDKALLLFAWGTGGRRRSEVADALMKDLIKTPENEFVYTIPKSKTDQEGKGNPVPAKGRVAKALIDWLNASGVTEGPIFRSLTKGGRVLGALSDKDIYRIVQRRMKLAGYAHKEYGAHSLRSGWVTEAARRGKPLGDVMQMTTHRSVETVMRYYQAGNIINNPAANLAD